MLEARNCFEINSAYQKISTRQTRALRFRKQPGAQAAESLRSGPKSNGDAVWADYRKRDLRLRQRCQLDEIGLCLILEDLLQRRLDTVFGGKIDAEWIDELLVFVKLEVEVRTGRSTGRADVTDDLAFRNRRPGMNPHGEAVQVSVAARVGRIVLDVDRFAVSTVPPGFGDHSIADRAHWSAALRGEIHAGVREVSFQDRMETGVG